LFFLISSLILTTNELEICCKHERVKLTTAISKTEWATGMLKTNSPLLSDSDRQPALMIIPGRRLWNHHGGNYKVVSPM
jgi:hypothetical protein